MVNLSTISASFNLRDILQYVIVCCIAFFIAAQPMVEVLLDSVNTEYELCETYEEDDVEEKEELKEEQKKEVELYTPRDLTYISSKHLLAHSMAENKALYYSNYIREFYLEILIPPPEQA